MKHLKTYNESVRDKMTPKSPEEIEKVMDNYKKTGYVRIYDELIGKIATEVKVVTEDNYNPYNGTDSSQKIIFKFKDGDEYKMYHQDDCSEYVKIEDINGDLEDLVGAPLLVAEEVTSKHPDASESGTWTFYKFATINGYVDVRWYGVSNGYYCETATIKKTN